MRHTYSNRTVKELKINREWRYILEEDNDGTLFLTVTYGGFADYEARVQLNEEERAGYLTKGDIFLNDLSRKISQNPQVYLNRG